jgi:hypothetical protein
MEVLGAGLIVVVIFYYAAKMFIVDKIQSCPQSKLYSHTRV